MSRMFYNRKGQSAIEYLMTYGWMLLVVAIVGGAIFATVQSQCAEQTSGFTGESVLVDTFEITDNDLQVVAMNGADEQITLENATLLDGDDTVDDATIDEENLNVGDTTLVTFDGVSSSDACNDYELEFEFDRGEITGAISSGTISGSMAQS